MEYTTEPRRRITPRTRSTAANLGRFCVELRLGQWHLSLTLVFILLGFLLATGFSTQQRLGERPGPRKDNLLQFIKKQRGEHANLEDQLEAARIELALIDAKRADSKGILAAYGRQLEGLKLRAGLTRVEGRGVEVIIGDAKRVPAGIDPDSFIIHDYDIQIIVNALWRGGAEAMAVNGERIVAHTGIRSAGSTILINSTPQGSPFRIKAIGNTKRMERVLGEDDDAALLLGEYSQQYGLVYRLFPRDRVRVPAYTGSMGLTGARRG